MGNARADGGDIELVSSPEPPSTPLLELALAAAAGDGNATGKLLRALAPRLVAIVRAVLGASHPDLDDAVQQALIGLVQALPAFRGDCDPLGYARVIAVRAAIAVRKRSRAQASKRDDEAETDRIAESHPTPGEQAAARQRKDLLRDLLAELPTEQAETLALRVVFGCSLEEVAKQTGVPLNTVRSRVRLAKERLKHRIEADASLLDALGCHEGRRPAPRGLARQGGQRRTHRNRARAPRCPRRGLHDVRVRTPAARRLP